MLSTDFDPMPLLRTMAQSIVSEHGRQRSVALAERAIARLHGGDNREAFDIWLQVHALLYESPNFIRRTNTIH